MSGVFSVKLQIVTLTDEQTDCFFEGPLFCQTKNRTPIIVFNPRKIERQTEKNIAIRKGKDK